MWALRDIFADAAVVEQSGRITPIFRQIWQELKANLLTVNTRNQLSATGLTAALATTTIYTTAAPGLYRVSVVLRKTVADGAASSLTPSVTTTDQGSAVTQTGSALTTDTTTAVQGTTFIVRADQGVAIQVAVAYSSTTPAKMTYNYDWAIEQLG